MLHIGRDNRLTNRLAAPGGVLTAAEFIRTWKAFARRRMSILLFFPVLCVAIAVLYLATAIPKYTADSVLLIEPMRIDGSGPTSAGDVGSATAMAATIDDQVEILKSEKIALSVIKALKLTQDPEFVGPGAGLLGRALALVSATKPDTESSLTRLALERLSRKLTVQRNGLSHTIGIEFVSTSPERAAQVANAVAQAYVADEMSTNYEAAHEATKWLRGRVSDLSTKVSDAQKAVIAYEALPSQNQAELRELEISAQTYRRLYDTFLQRYLKSTEQESFPTSPARLMTVASAPLTRSSPKPFLVLTLSVACGIIAGLGAGLLRDASDLTFHTGDDVLSELHTDCIGIIPSAVAEGSASDPPISNLIPTPARARSRTIVCTNHLFGNIVDTPRSDFSESFRSVKLAVDTANRGAKRVQVIGVTSALANEGKSTVAASLARLIARAGDRTILLDCNLRNPSLSVTLAADATLGLSDVASRRTSLEDATWIDPHTHLHFLPAAASAQLAYSSEGLASEDIAALFKRLRESYEYVIVDLSPMAPFVDVRAAAHLMDAFILVIEWGRTDIDVVKKSLGGSGDVEGRLIGVTLNKANVWALKRYGDPFGSYHRQYPERQRPWG